MTRPSPSNEDPLEQFLSKTQAGAVCSMATFAEHLDARFTAMETRIRTTICERLDPRDARLGP